jgi:predicted phosphoribosyltransferase
MAFFGISQFYDSFPQLTDAEVILMLAAARPASVRSASEEPKGEAQEVSE